MRESRATGTTPVSSSFHDRFTPRLARRLEAVAAYLVGRVVEPSRSLAGPPAASRDVVLTDSTVIRLHDLLQRAFAA